MLICAVEPGIKASSAARNNLQSITSSKEFYRFVVPSAFVAALLAEQTNAIRFFVICDLPLPPIQQQIYPTTSSAIFVANLPTLVPPNFCTIHPISNELV